MTIWNMSWAVNDGVNEFYIRTRGDVDTVVSTSCISFSESSAPVLAHIARKSSTASRLSLNRCNVLISATTSERCSRFEFE